MIFWILDQRDTYSRELNGACFYKRKKPSNFGECSVVCPECGSVCGPRVWLPPYNVRLSKPECGDLILGAGFELLVSERFCEVYSNGGLSGLVESHSIDNLILPGQAGNVPIYYVVRPKITFTVLDETASGLTWKKLPNCNHCSLGVRAGIQRIVVNEDSWDGSDIFMATGFYGSILVTDRFVKAVQKAKLSNFVFVAADQYSEKT